MSEIVNNPADRKAIIRDQSRLSKFLMFIPVAFCFFCFVILSCIDVWKTHLVHLPCFAVWKEGQGRFKTAISVHITNKKYLGRSSGTASAWRELRWGSPNTVFTGKCISDTFAMKQICNEKPVFLQRFCLCSSCASLSLNWRIPCLDQLTVRCVSGLHSLGKRQDQPRIRRCCTWQFPKVSFVLKPTTQPRWKYWKELHRECSPRLLLSDYCI